MKLHGLALAFLAATVPFSDPVSARRLEGRASCNHNNCLRQMLRAPCATAFCSIYTKTVNTELTALPTYVSQCSSDPARISSACSCLPTVTPSTTPSSSADPSTSSAVPSPSSKPPASSSEPPASSEPPTPSSEPPVPSSEPSAPSSDPPASSSEPPASSSEVPASSSEPSATSSEPPASSSKPPAPSSYISPPVSDCGSQITTTTTTTVTLALSASTTTVSVCPTSSEWFSSAEPLPSCSAVTSTITIRIPESTIYLSDECSATSPVPSIATYSASPSSAAGSSTPASSPPPSESSGISQSESEPSCTAPLSYSISTETITVSASCPGGPQTTTTPTTHTPPEPTCPSSCGARPSFTCGGFECGNDSTFSTAGRWDRIGVDCNQTHGFAAAEGSCYWYGTAVRSGTNLGFSDEYSMTQRVEVCAEQTYEISALVRADWQGRTDDTMHCYARWNVNGRELVMADLTRFRLDKRLGWNKLPLRWNATTSGSVEVRLVIDCINNYQNMPNYNPAAEQYMSLFVDDFRINQACSEPTCGSCASKAGFFDGSFENVGPANQPVVGPLDRLASGVLTSTRNEVVCGAGNRFGITAQDGDCFLSQTRDLVAGSTGISAYWAQSMELCPGVKYLLTGWVRVDLGGRTPRDCTAVWAGATGPNNIGTGHALLNEGDIFSVRTPFNPGEWTEISHNWTHGIRHSLNMDWDIPALTAVCSFDGGAGTVTYFADNFSIRPLCSS